MEGYLFCQGGRTLKLKDWLRWKLEYTTGTPCDSFELECPWTGGDEEALSSATEFTATESGETVFRGVVDEFEIITDQRGRRLCLSGRGMAALLLDNEALGMDYQTATAADILRDHVTPYGIQVAGGVELPAVTGFSVEHGSSEWQVLYQFARYYGGVTPRFDRTGRLVLSPWNKETALLMDDGTPVTALRYRERRYGVLSEVLVRDRTRYAVERVENQRFKARGGRRRQVLTMPGRSSHPAMRYSGEFQIRRSEAQWVRLEVEVPKLFAAWPGELVEVRRTGFGFNGVYRVLEAAVEMDEKGARTSLTMGEADVAL